MRDYLVSKLEESNDLVVPRTKEIVSGIKSNYLTIGEEGRDGIVLLIDKSYTGNGFKELFQRAKRRTDKQSGEDRVGVVFLKDGDTYFRSAKHRGHQKIDGRSLKKYSAEDVQKLMMLSPPEIALLKRSYMQYYQPDSSRLKEGLEGFQFKPVIFDYSHVPEGDFKPDNAPSKRFFIWNFRGHVEDDLVLDGAYLKSVDA